MAGEGILWQEVGVLVRLCTSSQELEKEKPMEVLTPQVRVVQTVRRRKTVQSPVPRCPAGSSPSGPIKQQDVIVDLGAAG